MFPSFIGILDIQSWWEVPSIAYFCSLFRSAFNLLDFDIEELEEALLTDGTEETASSLLTELIVRLLNGCLGNNDISAFNYQMYLRRLFRQKCQDTGRRNPFNSDIDFQFLPLRTKVEILYALCDFRLDGEDVFDLFKNLEAESLRIEPLGWDDNESAYWYFYGTRLYREDTVKKSKGKHKKKKSKELKKRAWFHGDDWLNDDGSERVWQVVCFTQEDWHHLTDKFSQATSKVEKELHRSLSQNFLPEIPRLFLEKERLQRKRLLEHAPRRTSSRVLQKIKDKEEESKPSEVESRDHREEDNDNGRTRGESGGGGGDHHARADRANRRNLIRSKSESSDSSSSSNEADAEMPLKVSKTTKKTKGQIKRSKNSPTTNKGEPPPEPPAKPGRKTNNSLASATGQIVIPDTEIESTNSTRKKLKTSQIFSQTEEDVQTDMYKVLEQLTAHEDAWPFMEPVEEEYAPNYYAVIRRPMDLNKMEERLDSGHYTDFAMFKADFKLIVNNCRLYNGQDNEYTVMVDNLQAAFDRLTEKYIHRLSSSDEEIAVEYQIPTPSRKHKLSKSTDSPPTPKKKKRKSDSESAPSTSTNQDCEQVDKREDHQQQNDQPVVSTSKADGKPQLKTKDGKLKKKHKGRHRKHSKNHKKEHGKGKHSKKQKHGKKSKKKKPPQEVQSTLTRSASQESVESSHRSRSASPLPSIHTPSPSPEPSPASPAAASTANAAESDLAAHDDFFKDKYDKIKERRRHTSKSAWDSLFDYKHKNTDKQKQNLNIPEKDKNQKLRETIEKLKAKNEKYKSTSLFTPSLFGAGKSNVGDRVETDTTDRSSDKDSDEDGSSDEDFVEKRKDKSNKSGKKSGKKNPSKNESASEALEQAVKDISKWLEDPPGEGSPPPVPSASPAHTLSTEDPDGSRLDDDFIENKSLLSRRELTRKRPSSREPKLLKRREIQRTIDRLQPGKSKGNLLTKTVDKVEEVTPTGPQYKAKDINKLEEICPKLSLGSVLPTVEFTLGKDHNFADDEENKNVDEKKVDDSDPKKTVEDNVIKEVKLDNMEIKPLKENNDIDDKSTVMKPSQEKATPNLSAWFKAFGAPKSTPPTVNTKKKTEEDNDEKTNESVKEDSKTSSPKHPGKYEMPVEAETTTVESTAVGGAGGVIGATSVGEGEPATPRPRRTSTGSSVSERSSFSQDLDSPRHHISHTSPLLRSPASPRTDDFQKITYPIINGTVRAGFYQDTTSIKSSPEKSCSPREGPQSPYSPYSQHVYASNNTAGSTTPNYFVDHNKSPLPTYGHNQPPSYYDSSKPSTGRARAHDDYGALVPDSYSPAPYGCNFSAAPSSAAAAPYAHAHQATYSQPQHSPRTAISQPPASTATTSSANESKNTLFPVKKRSYNDMENSTTTVNKLADIKDIPNASQNKNDYQKMVQTMQSLSSIPTSSVDEIAAALSEKSELTKMREKAPIEFMDRLAKDNRNVTAYSNNDTINMKKKDSSHVDPNKPIGMTINDNVDMVNMGYMNPENERRLSGDAELNYSTRHIPKSTANTQPKGYEIDAIAMNLGMNNQNLQKLTQKPSVSCTPIPPAHSHERVNTDIGLNHHLLSQHSEYDTMTSSGQNVSNFSLNDIELANKKLYSSNATASNTAIDYGNWKLTNQMRKPDIMPSDYSINYSAANTDRSKSDVSTTNTAPINFNKNMQHQQQYYNVPRSSLQNLPSELRIPNPRGLLKNDHLNISSGLSNNELMPKNLETTKTSKSDKIIQNHPLVGSLPYKTPYSAHSGLPLDSLRNLSNIPQMLERYSNDERYLSFAAASGSSLYHDKTFQMAQMSQMFNKAMTSDVHATSTTSSVYSQPPGTMSKDSGGYKTGSNHQTGPADSRSKPKRKRTSEAKSTPMMSSQGFHPTACSGDVLSSVKSGMVAGSAFNFGASNMPLGGGLYSDNSGFTNQLMAANYMAAAAAAHQRSTGEGTGGGGGGVGGGGEKAAKPAHQGSAFGFGAGGSYFPAEPSSPLYQQYLQRHQEELLRQTGAQIMGLYPPGYPAALAARQPYDRHAWL